MTQSPGIEYAPWREGGGVRMGLVPLARHDWLRRPIDTARRLQERQALAAASLEKVWGCTATRLVAPALDETRSLLHANHQPLGTAYRTDTQIPTTEREFLNAGLAVCEDICVLLPDDGDYVLHAALLCAPSFWRLREKLGRPLHDIHGPVVDLEAKIGARIRAFLHNLPSDRLFTRGNWHLHNTGEYFHPEPDDWSQAQTLTHENIAARLWLRCERQTLRKLPASGALLFTILVYVQPLAVLATQPELANALWDAYLAMPRLERSTRHFEAFAAPLRGWLDRLPTQPRQGSSFEEH